MRARKVICLVETLILLVLSACSDSDGINTSSGTENQSYNATPVSWCESGATKNVYGMGLLSDTLVVAVGADNGYALYSNYGTELKKTGEIAAESVYTSWVQFYNNCIWVLDKEETKYVVKSFDALSNLQKEIPLTIDQDITAFTILNTDSTTIIALMAGTDLILVNGNDLKTISFTGYSTQLVANESDAFLIVVQDESGQQALYKVSIDGEITDTLQIDKNGLVTNGKLFFYDQNGIIYAGDGVTILSSVQDCSIAPSYIRFFTEIDVDEYALCYSSPLSHHSLVALLSKTNPDRDTINLTFGTTIQDLDELDGTITYAISAFNTSQNQYKIEIRQYPNENQLKIAMLTGDGPDILSMATLSEDVYLSSGLLSDLYTNMKDSALSKELFVPSYINAQEVEGHLYTLSSSFCVRTLVSKSEYVGNNAGWTLADLSAIAERLPDNMIILPDTSSTDFLSLYLSYALSEYVNWDDHTCQFETDQFYALLSFCKEHFDLYAKESGLFGRDALESSLLNYWFVYQPQSYADNMRTYGSDCTLIGYPDAGGNGAVLYNSAEDYAINGLSLHQKDAWAFFEFILSDDFQNSLLYGFPVVENDFENAISNATLPNDEGQAFLSDMEAETLKEMILNAKELGGSGNSNPSFLVDIICEEAGAYFANDKTVEDVAKIIQNRVSIYLSEQQ